MNNLKKFATEAEYSAATLNYPAVSWVTATDNVHFDKSGSTPTVNDKVMIASYGGESGDPSKFIFYNCEASSSNDITAITLDNVAVEPITCETESIYDARQLHIAKYDLSATTVGDWCSGNLGCMYASDYANVDILYPSQITEITVWPDNTKNMVVEAETPPYIEGLESSFQGDGIYVPDSAVNAYKSEIEWGSFEEIIHPI